MQSVNRLVAEHDIIERALTLLEAVAARIDANQPVPADFVRWAPEFFSRFADKCHHAKEEDVFFPLLKERGIPEEGGPIGVMLNEHVLGRDCVRRMREASEKAEFDGAQFVAAARQLVPLLRQHIFKENNVLFKMAENVLNEADDGILFDRFTEVEQERELAGLHEKYNAEVTGWEKTLG